jgi:hypothetical protein
MSTAAALKRLQPEPAPEQVWRGKEIIKISAHHGRFFFFAPPCMVEENFTGRLLKNAGLLPFSS